MIFTIQDGVTPKGKPRASLVLLMQRGAKHSKYYDLTCFCGRKRKDGSCKHTDAVLEIRIQPGARARVRVTPTLAPAGANETGA